ncbi:MAG: hypothetical protein LUC95_07075 [Lachnospiraceae bacterium]|nr:hypothetical protein [Lachnospiraceae bacterium]
MKKGLMSWIGLLVICVLALTGCTPFGRDAGSGGGDTSAKPVIYLYPEETTEVNVQLDFNGTLTCTYPVYEDGWTVTAEPDGTLKGSAGQTYRYLYWEGINDFEPDFSRGFCVAGEETAAFLETALVKLGLNREEANEFIIYWLPLMEGNAYNLISFQRESYTDNAVLTVSPEPDTVIRVYMAWKGLDEPVEIAAQELSGAERIGFTLVEWGGCEVTVGLPGGSFDRTEVVYAESGAILFSDQDVTEALAVVSEYISEKIYDTTDNRTYQIYYSNLEYPEEKQKTAYLSSHYKKGYTEGNVIMLQLDQVSILQEAYDGTEWPEVVSNPDWCIWLGRADADAEWEIIGQGY